MVFKLTVPSSLLHEVLTEDGVYRNEDGETCVEFFSVEEMLNFVYRHGGWCFIKTFDRERPALHLVKVETEEESNV